VELQRVDAGVVDRLGLVLFCFFGWGWWVWFDLVGLVGLVGGCCGFKVVWLLSFVTSPFNSSSPPSIIIS
jgi:hypothetical protein